MRIESKEHRDWVAKENPCAVKGKYAGSACGGDVIAAHVRNGTDGGTGLKPSDIWVIPLCDKHHREQHQRGELSFAAKYDIDLNKTAEEMAKKSPHIK